MDELQRISDLRSQLNEWEPPVLCAGCPYGFRL